MTDLARRLARLSAQQQAVLLKRLKAKKSAVAPPSADGGAALTRISRRLPGTDPLPLALQQQRLWFLEQWRPGTATYHVPATFEALGELDPAAFSRALNALTGRHEALRARFRSEAGRPFQVIAEPEEGGVPVVDLVALAAGARRIECRRLTRREVLRPFDLGRDRLLRVLLIRLEGERHRVVFVLHHIVADGWSLGLIVHEMETLYGAASSSCRPIVLVRLFRPGGETPCRSGCPSPFRATSPTWPGTGARRSSTCCWPPSPLCSRASAASATWWSARSPRGVIVRRSRTSSASSSTPWPCAST